jgi:hypothetical protein
MAKKPSNPTVSKKKGKNATAINTTLSPGAAFQHSVEVAKARHKLLRSVEGSEEQPSTSTSSTFVRGEDTSTSTKNDEHNANDNDNAAATSCNHNTSTLTDASSSGAGGIIPFLTLLFGKSYTASTLPNKEVLVVLQNRKSFQKNHVRRFFAAMTDTLVRIIEEEAYTPESAFQDQSDDDADDDPATIEPDPASTEALLYMKGCALAVETYIEGEIQKRVGSAAAATTQEYSVMEEVFSVAELLHDTLFSLSPLCGKLGESVQRDICRMCEMWWHGAFQYRDPLVTQLVPLLLSKSLDFTDTHEPKAADVKRVWAMKDALELFDFDEASISYLKSLMLRTLSSPLYLKSVDGKRMIVALFQLHESMVSDIHSAIRAQIPSAKKALLQAYGDIYFRAWKLAFENAPQPDDEDASVDGSQDDRSTKEEDEDNDDDENHNPTNPKNILRSIEEHILQDLMYRVLHSAQPCTAKALRTVLAVFHTSKRSPDVEHLLYRLYGPIVWRALKAANPLIKVNAAAILADTFPLRDPTALVSRLTQVSGVPSEDIIEKTAAALLSLLQDAHPNVRVAGADATARILAAFWDAIPPEHIRSLLNCK